jgi:hypothetical protein
MSREFDHSFAVAASAGVAVDLARSRHFIFAENSCLEESMFGFYSDLFCNKLDVVAVCAVACTAAGSAAQPVNRPFR